MGKHAALLAKVIDEHGLADRDARIMQVRCLLEQGKLSEGLARAYLYSLEDRIEHDRDFPVRLHRPPTAEQLYANGKADIEFLTLMESEAGDRYGSRFLDRPRHHILAGATGSGKTNALRKLIIETATLRGVSGKPISIVIFDRKGGDYADLPHMLGPDWLHLSANDGLRLGLNGPEGTPPNVWANIVSTLFCARAGLIMAWVSLANMIRFLLAAMNPRPQGELLWPDPQTLLDLATSTPLTSFAAKPDYGKSLIQALEGAVQASGDLFRSFSGLEVERHIIAPGKSVVIEMANLSPPWLRQFFVDLVIAQILFGRIHRHQRTDTTEVLIVLDEADQDVSRKSEAAFPDGLSPLGALLKQGREFGLACSLGLSVLGNASRFILSNAQYHMIFNLSDAESVVEAKRTLLLPPGAEQQLPSLKPGEAFFREAQGAWHHPMWVKVDPVEPCRLPPPDHYDTVPFISSQRLDDMPHVKEAIKKLVAQRLNRESRVKAMKLSGKARELLDAASLHPFFPVARLFEQIGKPSPNAQDAICKSLEGKLAAFDDLRIGRRNARLIELTDEGWRFLGKAPPRRKLRGGIAHTHISQWLAMVGRKRGYKIQTEWIVPDTNHPTDAVWRVDGQYHVFEVIVSAQGNLTSHLEACLLVSKAVATVTIVAPLKSTLTRLEKSLDPRFDPVRDRVAFESAEAFVQELWP